MRLSILAIVAALSLGVSADKGAPFSVSSLGTTNLYGCRTYLNKVATFCADTSAGGRGGGGRKNIEKRARRGGAAYKCVCYNKNALASMVGCYDVAGKNDKYNMHAFMKLCEDSFNVTVTQDQWDSAYEYYKSSAIPMSDMSKYNDSGVITRPVMLPKKTVDLYMESYDVFMGNYRRSVYYSVSLIAYWILILGLFAINNWAKFLLPSVFVRSKGSKAVNKFKKHVGVPAAFGQEKQDVLRMKGPLGSFFQILMPSRVETLILIGFLFLSIAFMGAQIHYVHNDPIFKTKGLALSRQIAVRTGIIAIINIPMLIMFGGRNNFLQWLTGMNFATFIMIHKWISRMFVIMLIMHSVCYSYGFGAAYKFKMKADYVIWGTLGTVAGSLLFVQSILVLRRKWYETFLIVHIVLAVLFVVGAWKHVDMLGYVWFMYLASAIWAFDRAVRIGRIFWFGFPKADLQLINNDTIKLRIPVPRRWKPTNGGFAYVYFLTKSRFFQSHPFSYLHMGNTITFHIKVKEGITKGFYKDLLNFPTQMQKVRVAIEGPYGGGLESCNVKNYHSAVFVAGGNGIPGMFSEAYHLGLRSEMQQRVKLIWVVRDYNHLNIMLEELQALKDTRVECEIYITRPNNSCSGAITQLIGDSEASSLEKSQDHQAQIEVSDSDKEKESLDSEPVIANVQRAFQHITFHHGRPVMDTLCSREIEECPGASVAFVACGNPSMVDEVRAQVAKNSDGEKRVDFYEHLQVWA